MSTADTAAALAEFEGRGAGTNAERRAALWLASELRSDRRQAAVETFWCRPNWALAHAWHVILAVGGSLLTVASPKVGGAVILVALVSLVLDGLTGSVTRAPTIARAREPERRQPRDRRGARDADRHRQLRRRPDGVRLPPGAAPV